MGSLQQGIEFEVEVLAKSIGDNHLPQANFLLEHAEKLVELLKAYKIMQER